MTFGSLKSNAPVPINSVGLYTGTASSTGSLSPITTTEQDLPGCSHTITVGGDFIVIGHFMWAENFTGLYQGGLYIGLTLIRTFHYSFDSTVEAGFTTTAQYLATNLSANTVVKLTARVNSGSGGKLMKGKITVTQVGI